VRLVGWAWVELLWSVTVGEVVVVEIADAIVGAASVARSGLVSATQLHASAATSSTTTAMANTVSGLFLVR
jgi:hypothetical protein